ncbi:MAG TPA: dihydrofolate reductase family protein [Thermomonospora sp.]|nr:dihydrofolate reductase family protein [Thermomonospora sp.]
MGKVVFDISMSLDGFVTAADRTPDEPLGAGGQRLHDWAFGDDERNRAFLQRTIGSLGAVIAGRRTYDDSIRWWGPDGPSGAARVPTFVVTHHPPPTVPDDGVYVFATDGIHDALERAKAVAADRTISIMGGPDIAHQYLTAGLVDEISIHIVPVLFGAGLRLFEDPTTPHISLEPLNVTHTPTAVHTLYRVLK